VSGAGGNGAGAATGNGDRGPLAGDLDRPEGRSSPARVEAPARPEHPTPSFAVAGARVPRHAAAPTLVFDLDVEEPSERQVLTISLAVQIAIEPAQRRYDEETRERLTELLGEPGRIGAPTRTMPWARVDVLVQSFRGKTRVEVPVLCSYDLEIAATSYFRSISSGEVPLVFHFNGGVYYQGEDGRLQIVQISWEESSEYRMPIGVWQEMIAAHYPYRGWVPAGSETIERLRRYKLEQGLPSYDAALERLMDR
jgi:hypothetical protein